jgi:hypothetical protein
MWLLKTPKRPREARDFCTSKRAKHGDNIVSVAVLVAVINTAANDF